MAKNWSEQEQILALNLYHLIPFGRLDRNTPEIIELARIMNRTPSSVSMKLCNFASLDPVIIESGRRGLPNVSNKDRQIWDWHINHPVEFQSQSESIFLQFENASLGEISTQLGDANLEKPPEGRVTQRSVTITARIGQSLFRQMVLDNYENKCCITGIDMPGFLVASHIEPWSINHENRLNPANGLCLSSLCDKAFDQGLITLNEQAELVLSARLKSSQSKALLGHFMPFENKVVQAGVNHTFDKKLMIYHRKNIFKPT